jgi:DNA-binding response OmpR family regulator
MDNKKILLIEDDSLTLLVLTNLLTAKNHTVISLNDGRKYEEYIKEVDIVILDCGLPFISGEEMARKIKSDYPEIKVVLTSVSSKENIKPSIMKKVDGFIGKPYNSEKINNLLNLLY